jgi:hypothetical protein
VDTIRLTDADFTDEAPTASTDAGTNPDNPGGYPDWDSPSVSLAPEDPPDGDAADSVQPTPIDTQPTPDEEPEADPPEVETETSPETPEQAAEAERIARLEAELAARDARIAQIEEAQRQEARAQLDQGAIWEEQQVDARLDHEWRTRVMPQAQRLQGAAQANFINARRQEFSRAAEQQKAQIAEMHRQGVIQLLAADPATQQTFYSQLLTEHNLPEEAREYLAEVGPDMAEREIPRLKKYYARLAKAEQERDQAWRDREVFKRAHEGADAMGGTHRTGGAIPKTLLDSNSPDFDLSLAYQSAGQWRRGR